ncbi:cobalamin biosynthesis protein CobW [Roseovarius faecimaris]|uniref:Cobalamin biosynthesis protein CobW n=1 Tax=Roseovarius faecimaris TaxID=2494550 RepID=A0A6I6ITM3_9RHOB|nr:cobalamin biosynthesis protein CobW [Roseovarius faecimaris]QGX99434.1 cobalamin biosynthesis protein CobW [Roseovarius faecimaris]
MRQKTPITIVTGFLGSGKTTLIRHILSAAQDRRIALIINEFGALGIDGALVQSAPDAPAQSDIVELANGCLCCAVDEDFVPSLQALLARDPAPEHIVVETSGLALPKPLIRALGWPDLAPRLTIDGVIAVVDGPALRDGRFDTASGSNPEHPDSSLASLFDDQTGSADLIILNKADLLSEGDQARLTDDLRNRCRAGTQILAATQSALPIEVLLGQSHTPSEPEPHHPHDHHHHHDHGGFDSFTLTRAEITDPALFQERLARVIVAHDLLRVKGFARVTGKPMRLTIQAVGPRIEARYDAPIRPDQHGTELVIIGRAGLDRDAIVTALEATC